MYNQTVFANIIVKNVIKEKTLYQSSKIEHFISPNCGKRNGSVQP